MSSTVCQGLQSCLEPQNVETSVLKFKLAPPKSIFSQSPLRPQNREENTDSHHQENKNNNGELGGWSFIQALTGTSNNYKYKTENENVYVHPLGKSSYPNLSTQSLEMCTESLGSETGSDISGNSDEFCSLLLKNQKFRATKRSKSRKCSKKFSRTGSFPPPLSSMSGLDGVKMRPHREDGRLVIRVISNSARKALFQAERVDGRLRLCLVNDFSANSDYEVTKNEEKVINEEDIEEVSEELENVAEEECDDLGEDMGGNSGKVGCEMGIGELPKPSRCKEGGNENKGMSNWGSPFWVIT